MDKKALQESLKQYNDQLLLVSQALSVCTEEDEKTSLLSLQTDLNQLINLTSESLNTINEERKNENVEKQPELDDEYALFMQEIANSGAYDDNSEFSKNKVDEATSDDSDIENELATLPGMKCAVHLTHKLGEQATLHNAMVSAVVPRENDDNFKDLQVQVLFTHPTYAEMLPCPFYLDGECRFNDDQCRYSHGNLVPFSHLKEAIEPNFESIKIGSKILVKLKPPENEDISLKKKCSEKYHLWHRSVVRSVNIDKQCCVAKLENGVRSGEKRKCDVDEVCVAFENIFPLNDEPVSDTESDDSISDTEYPEYKTIKPTEPTRSLVAEQSLQNGGQALGEWERYTRGIGSKLMFAMGYVAGEGLGAAGDGRVLPVPAKVMPKGRGLDHCLSKENSQDPLKVQQKLKRMQKKEEQRQRRAYEREKERERRNVFNFINRTIGDQHKEENNPSSSTNIKKSSTKDLNIEQFKINEEAKRLDKEIVKLNSSLSRHSEGTPPHRNIKLQIVERHKELDALKNKERQIAKEQSQRKDKQKMTVF